MTYPSSSPITEETTSSYTVRNCSKQNKKKFCSVLLKRVKGKISSRLHKSGSSADSIFLPACKIMNRYACYFRSERQICLGSLSSL